MVKGLVIPVESGAVIEERDFATLEDYQAAVDGWIEAVDVPALGVTIYVNEEGLLRRLLVNHRATFLWWYHVPEARERAMLVGTAIVIGLPDRAGNSTDIPDDVRAVLVNAGAWRVEVRTHGDPTWYRNQATYRDYFEALAWGMVTLEQWTTAEDVRVVPVLADEIAGDAPSPAA